MNKKKKTWNTKLVKRDQNWKIKWFFLVFFFERRNEKTEFTWKFMVVYFTLPYYKGVLRQMELWNYFLTIVNHEKQ